MLSFRNMSSFNSSSFHLLLYTAFASELHEIFRFLDHEVTFSYLLIITNCENTNQKQANVQGLRSLLAMKQHQGIKAKCIQILSRNPFRIPSYLPLIDRFLDLFHFDVDIPIYILIKSQWKNDQFHPYK